MNIADRYIYRVVWSEEDQEFFGLCAEFPSLSHLDHDRHSALSGITDLVRVVVADLEKDGDPIPEPIIDQKYSGELRLRMPPHLHRRLATEAAEKHTSLNSVIVRRLQSA
jgi:predicted HicB family RNase H-like nuclease